MARTVALAVGLGVGLGVPALILGLLVLCFLRNRRWARKHREKGLTAELDFDGQYLGVPSTAGARDLPSPSTSYISPQALEQGPTPDAQRVPSEQPAADSTLADFQNSYYNAPRHHDGELDGYGYAQQPRSSRFSFSNWR
jgi:hypothetical protein